MTAFVAGELRSMIDAEGVEQQKDARPKERSHLMTRAQAREWLVGSAIQQIVVHRTNAASAQAMDRQGIDVTVSDVDTGWGRGFYASSSPDPQYGDVSVRVAIRLMNPLIVEDSIEGAATVDDLMQRTGTDTIREALVAVGHDGVVIHFGGWGDWVVAYFSEQVRIVVE